MHGILGMKRVWKGGTKAPMLLQTPVPEDHSDELELAVACAMMMDRAGHSMCRAGRGT